MSLYDGDWNLYREDMCICPKCGKDEITHCICDEVEKIDNTTKFNLYVTNSYDEIDLMD